MQSPKQTAGAQQIQGPPITTSDVMCPQRPGKRRSDSIPPVQRRPQLVESAEEDGTEVESTEAEVGVVPATPEETHRNKSCKCRRPRCIFLFSSVVAVVLVLVSMIVPSTFIFRHSSDLIILNVSDLSDLPDLIDLLDLSVASDVSVAPDVLANDNDSVLLAIMGALACPGLYADILDMLSAAHLEFTNATHGNDVFMGLQAIAKDTVEVARRGVTETDFADTLSSIVGDSSGMIPMVLQNRLRELLYLPCEAATCTEKSTQSLPLTIDASFTNAGTGDGRFDRILRKVIQIGGMTGLHSYQSRAKRTELRPVYVVFNSSAPVAGDCFAFHNDGSVAFNIGGRNPIIGSAHLVIEQPPRWTLVNPASAPRRFTVHGKPSIQLIQGSLDSPYTIFLGSFEYVLAGPSAQAFQFNPPESVSGLHIEFEGPGWGEQFTCIYRLRLYEAEPPSCNRGRLTRVSV